MRSSLKNVCLVLKLWRAPNLNVLQFARYAHLFLLVTEMRKWQVYNHCSLNFVPLFFTLDHQNFFGVDERLGPVAVSFRREEKEGSSGSQYNYRIIFRTTEVNAFPTHKVLFSNLFIFSHNIN